MRYLGEDEVGAMMGVGYLGEVRRGPGGAMYQWVEGVDGLGNPVGGFWKRLKQGLRRVAPVVAFGPAAALVPPKLRRGLLRSALPFAQYFAPLIPGVGPAAATALRYASPFLRQAGVAGYGGLGALYQAPDGSLYQVQGSAEGGELVRCADG